MNNFEKKYKTLDDFIKLFVSIKKPQININNITVYGKIENVYTVLCNSNVDIKMMSIKQIFLKMMNFKFKNKLQVGFWLERGIENGVDIISDMQKKSSKMVKNRFHSTFENLSKLGYTKDDIKNWRNGPMFIKYWTQQGFTELESINKVKDFQSQSSNKNDFSKIIYNTKIEYYLNRGFNNEDSLYLLKERQNTISLIKNINKHGICDGTKIYNNLVLNRSNYLGCSKKGYSDISQNLFNDIMNNYKCCDNDIFYATKNKEYKINKSLSGYWLYDFTDVKKRKIIEFQGDRYHANPNIYEEHDTPHPFQKNKKSIDIWNDDKMKRIDAENHNFSVFYVWELDFKRDKNGILESCLKFLNG